MGTPWRALLCVLAAGTFGGHDAFAQPTAESTSGPQCAFRRDAHPEYILWLCNPEGTAPAVEGSVLWVRTNAAGAEVMTSVWQGPSKDLVARADTIIGRHRQFHRGCLRFIHMGRASKQRVVWNLAPEAAFAALNATSAWPHVCYSQEPGAADFVILWGEHDTDLPNAFTVVIPPSADASAPAPMAPGLPKRLRTLVLPSVSVGVYRVDPGMDNTLLRLGLAVYTATSDATPKRTVASVLQSGIRAVAQQPASSGTDRH